MNLIHMDVMINWKSDVFLQIWIAKLCVAQHAVGAFLNRVDYALEVAHIFQGLYFI